MTQNHPAKAAILALTRHQIRALVQAAQRRDQHGMNLLEESWAAVAGIDPALTAAVEALCDDGQKESMPRFKGFHQDEEREARQYVGGPAGRIPRLLTSFAGLLLVAAGAAALGGTPLPVLLAAVATSIALVVAGGIMSVRITAARFEHVFRDPAMACEHVWVAATDAVLALELQRKDVPAELREHLLNLTGLWTEAGLPLEILHAPAGYRLAA